MAKSVVNDYNGSVLAEVGDLEHESFNPPQKPIEAEMLMLALMPPILANTCYQQPFFQLKY